MSVTCACEGCLVFMCLDHGKVLSGMPWGREDFCVHLKALMECGGHLELTWLGQAEGRIVPQDEAMRVLYAQ